MSALQPITLVLLPGMHGSGQLFVPLVRELPDYITPLLVSYPTDRPLDYRGHLDIVMAALPVNEPFVLLGESFSGPLALMAAARNPKGLRGVILCATFVAWPLSLPVAFGDLLVSMGLFRMKTTQLFLRVLLGKGASGELKALFAAALAPLTPVVMAARARAVMEVDCSAALRECRVPLLAMDAKHDRIVARRSLELIRTIRPDVEIEHIRAPHLILQCAPVEAGKVIDRFLKTTGVNADYGTVVARLEGEVK